MDNNIKKLKRAIGIDYEHAHGPDSSINPQAPPVPPIPQPTQEMPPIKPFDVGEAVQEKPPQPKEPIKITPPSPEPQIKPQTPKDNDHTLFVKIDKHQDVAQEIHEAKKEMKNMLDTISLLNQAEKLKQEAIAKLESDLSRFDTKFGNIESFLGFKVLEEDHKPQVNRAGENLRDLGSLHNEIKSLKDELNILK